MSQPKRVQLTFTVSPESVERLGRLADDAGICLGSAAGLVVDLLTPETPAERQWLICSDWSRVLRSREWKTRVQTRQRSRRS